MSKRLARKLKDRFPGKTAVNKINLSPVKLLKTDSAAINKATKKKFFSLTSSIPFLGEVRK